MKPTPRFFTLIPVTCGEVTVDLRAVNGVFLKGGADQGCVCIALWGCGGPLEAHVSPDNAQEFAEAWAAEMHRRECERP